MPHKKESIRLCRKATSKGVYKLGNYDMPHQKLGNQRKATSKGVKISRSRQKPQKREPFINYS
jgi:hypothetical protein